MPAQRDVAVLVGSLRRESWNRKAAEAVAKLAPEHLRFRFVDYSYVSAYNQDLDTDTPPEDWKRLRDDLRGAGAVLFATPEYNRSVPGALKNAIDVGSRPYGKSVFAKKPAAIISVSIGQIGGFGANHHLRQMLAYLDMPTLAQPEMYLGPAAKLFGENGEVKEESTRDLLRQFGKAFADWIDLTAIEHDAGLKARVEQETRSGLH